MGAGTQPNLFASHPRSWRDNRFVYPVISRRSCGLSIGVNLNPDTVCNFDCVYCCVDRTTPPATRRVDLPTLRRELDHLLRLALTGELFTDDPFTHTPPHLRRLNDVAFSGDGEPTAYPHFLNACKLVADAIKTASELRGAGDSPARIATPLKIVLITNATLLHRPSVRDALAYLDRYRGEVWAKLDAGTEPYYHAIERTRVPFSRVLDNILLTGRARPIVIQSMFLTLHGLPPSATELTAYLNRLRVLTNDGCQISRVQVYTTARQTALPDITPLPSALIDQIVQSVRSLGLAADGFYGPT